MREGSSMVTRTLAELAAELKGHLVGDGSLVIRDVAGIREALPGDITFIANSRYDAYLEETRASAVICARPSGVWQRRVRIWMPCAMCCFSSFRICGMVRATGIKLPCLAKSRNSACVG